MTVFFPQGIGQIAEVLVSIKRLQVNIFTKTTEVSAMFNCFITCVRPIYVE